MKDQFFDLKGLSEYSTLHIPTLRDYIRKDNLPCFEVRGKILIRRSEFDQWLNQFRMRKEQDLNAIADEMIKNLKSDK